MLIFLVLLRLIPRNEINNQKAETFLHFLICMSLGYLKGFSFININFDCMSRCRLENLVKTTNIFLSFWSPNIFILLESGSSQLLKYYLLQMRNVPRK